MNTKRVTRWFARAIGLGFALMFAHMGNAQMAPVMACSTAAFASVTVVADAPVTILSADPATTPAPASMPYCLVKVRIPTAVNIWVGLPNSWNGRWQSLGGGGFAGSVSAPVSAVNGGYAGATTDTGHVGGSGTFGCVNDCVGNNASNPGQPNIPLQIDFAYRSEHLMAVVGKQLVKAYYGKSTAYSYWNGCSTGGRQGLRMAEDFPGDYDGILAGAPAIHYDRFHMAELWPQVAMNLDNGGLIGGGASATLNAKEKLATDSAIAACDALDGVADGVLTDPRVCKYSAAADKTITRATCTASDSTCLTPTEATAIDKMWQGPVSCSNGHANATCPVPDFATRNFNGKGNKRLWYALTRGTPLNSLGGVNAFPIPVAWARYFVYFDPTWNWNTLTYDGYVQLFEDSARISGPLQAADNPDLSAFRNNGSKLLLWHGFADQLIMPEGTIEYYDAVAQALGGGYRHTQDFARLFLAPGVGHCGGGAGPQPQNLLDALVNWVESGAVPDAILASQVLPGNVTRTRPLCPYPQFARYVGYGNTDDAANFVCTK